VVGACGAPAACISYNLLKFLFLFLFNERYVVSRGVTRMHDTLYIILLLLLIIIILILIASTMYYELCTIIVVVASSSSSSSSRQ
jgi:hypothetical protein